MDEKSLVCPVFSQSHHFNFFPSLLPVGCPMGLIQLVMQSLGERCELYLDNYNIDDLLTYFRVGTGKEHWKHSWQN